MNLRKERTVFIFFIFCFLSLILIIRLFFLQIKYYDFFSNLAHKQYYVSLVSKQERGIIFDRHGLPLALNKESISAFIMPHKIKDHAKLETFLKNYYPAAFERLKDKKHSYFMYVKRKLTAEEENFIKKEIPEDIYFIKEPSRFYSQSATASITGITNIDNQGVFGIELWYNNLLSGTPTTVFLEKDARSGRFCFSENITDDGKKAESITLTIDAQLQFLVQQELVKTIEKYKSSQGAAIIMNPETGDIYALATYPTFETTETKHLENVTTKNVAVTESYEFGSAFKAFFALAALEENMVTPDELIDCHNAATAFVEGRRVNTVPHSVAGTITFSEVIQKSNNIGIAKIAKRLGTPLYDHYKKMGFGQKTNIPFPGEQAGFLMHPHQWSKQSVISLSYGYEVSATLLQLATAFCLFCNGGHRIFPKLLVNQKTPVLEKIYSDQTIQTMRTILQETAESGTAKYAKVDGYLTIGKTSTANLLENGVYNPHKNLYGFVGAIEKGSYKRVIACFIKESPYHNLYAATVAAPLFYRIAEKMIVHDTVW